MTRTSLRRDGLPRPESPLTSRNGDPYRAYLNGRQAEARAHYAGLDFSRLSWPGPRRALRAAILTALKDRVPFGSRVLDVGCGDGDLLEGLAPRRGLGIDFCAEQVERARRRAAPGLEFRLLDAESCSGLGETFDTILLVNVMGELLDIRAVLEQLRSLCHASTHVILCSHSTLWWPVFAVTQALRLSHASLPGNWLSRSDIETFVRLSDFEIVSSSRFFPLPAQPTRPPYPGWRWLSRLPLVERAGIYEMTVLRPAALARPDKEQTTTIVVPCKNEEGNIDEAVRRIPKFGKGVELIFVDDRSSDGTAAKIKENIAAHPGRNIRLIQGPGLGKAAAVRAGLAQATGDLYMILDADLTVAPEVLPEFYRCLVSQKGDFINGSRMVYPMAGDAMRAANIVGNKLFAALFSFLLRQPIKDTLCGTKAVRAADYAKILAARPWWGETDRWGDYDWLFGAAVNGLKIVELPVHYFERTSGKTKMTARLRNASVMLKMCLLAMRRLR